MDKSLKRGSSLTVHKEQLFGFLVQVAEIEVSVGGDEKGVALWMPSNLSDRETIH